MTTDNEKILAEIDVIKADMIKTKRQASQLCPYAIVIPKGRAIAALNRVINFIKKIDKK